jgi:pimeloyl-ACP methyl ester carboxylesterase
LQLQVQIDGNGPLVVFAHEFADDMTSWRDQVAALEGSFRCATYNARGWPGSEAPSVIDEYSQAHAADDVLRVVEGAGRADARLVGLSMGSMAVLHCARRHPAAVRSLVLCGCGPGSLGDSIADWRNRILTFADEMEQTDRHAFALAYSKTSARRRLAEKNPTAAADSIEKLASRCIRGPLMTLRNTIAKRSLLAECHDELRKQKIPVLIVCGDEDEPCVWCDFRQQAQALLAEDRLD